MSEPLCMLAELLRAPPEPSQGIYRAGSHLPALRSLLCDLKAGIPFMVITGPAGVGKTMLLTAAFPPELEDSKSLVRVNSPSGKLITLPCLLTQVGDGAHEQNRGDKRTIILIDDAHLLSFDAIRYLTRILTGTPEGRLRRQVLMIGQPILWTVLAKVGVAEKARSSGTVDGLSLSDSRQYLHYRIAPLSVGLDTLLSDGAALALAHRAGGLPAELDRLLALACKFAAHHAAPFITREIVEAVATAKAGAAASELRPIDLGAITNGGYIAVTPPSFLPGSGDGKPGTRRISSLTAPPIDVPRERLLRLRWAAAGIALALSSGVALMHSLSFGPEQKSASLAFQPERAFAPDPVNELPGAVVGAPGTLINPERQIALPQSCSTRQMLGAIAGALLDEADQVSYQQMVNTPEMPRQLLPASQIVANASEALTNIRSDLDLRPTEGALTADDSIDAVPIERTSLPEDMMPAFLTRPRPDESTGAASNGPAVADTASSELLQQAAIAGASGSPHSLPSVARPSSYSGVEMPSYQVSAVMRRGEDMLARGEILAARSLYKQGASTNFAPAVTIVGKTYDPIFLSDISASSVNAEATLAAFWYERAIALGDQEARERLDRLQKRGGRIGGR